MTRALLVAALLAASSSVAAAGPYAGLAIGPSPSIDDDSLDMYATGRTGRFLVGYRFNRFSAEGSITANSATDPIGNDMLDFDARHLMLAGKYNHPLASGFEVFGKAGLLRSSYSSDRAPERSGSSIVLGGGAEYVRSLGVATVTGFVAIEVSSVNTESIQYGPNKISSLQTLIGFTVGM